MSTGAGGQPPSQPPIGGPSRDPPSGKPMFNSWTENKKIKTCKCTVCDGRVRATSQKCDGCGRNVCSDCLDPASNKDSYYKAAAKNRIEVGCWACNWRSNMNPAFANRKPAPEVRTDEERRARASKALGARRKATAEASRSRPVAIESAESLEDDCLPEQVDAHDSSGREAVMEQGSATAARCNGQGIKRKRDHEGVADDSEVVDTSSSAKAAKEAGQRSAPRKSDQQFTKPTTLTGSSATFDTDQTSNTSSIEPKTAAMFDEDGRAPYEYVFEGASTVIAGGGVVGLFIAYELATKLKEHGIKKHEITVVEVNGKVGDIFPLASGMCAGILGTAGMPDLWSEGILKEARAYWQDLISNPDFAQDDIYLGDHALTVAADGDVDTTQRANIPSWYHGEDRTLIADTESFGRIDPQTLGPWLHKQCERLGVQFWFNYYVAEVESYPHFLSQVIIKSVAEDRSHKLGCQNLVLAAGPYTTRIFTSLFAQPAVQLENYVQRVHRFLVPVKDVTNEDRTVLRLPNAAQHNETFQNEIKMAVMPLFKSVQVSGVSSETRALDVGMKEALTRKPSRTNVLRSVAAKCLNHDGMDVTDEKAYPSKEPHYLLSTANEKNPIIDRVPKSALGKIAFQNEDDWETGVWLCYGFGAHGTTLAPGAARILVSRMLYAENGLSNYDFGLPTYVKPVDRILAEEGEEQD